MTIVSIGELYAAAALIEFSALSTNSTFLVKRRIEVRLYSKSELLCRVSHFHRDESGVPRGLSPCERNWFD
jgi:hypothetical protein